MRYVAEEIGVRRDAIHEHDAIRAERFLAAKDRRAVVGRADLPTSIDARIGTPIAASVTPQLASISLSPSA